MDKATTDLLLERLFRTRRLTLWAGVGYVALSLAPFLCDFVPDLSAIVFTEFGHSVLTAAMGALLIVIFAGSLLMCRDVFRIGSLEASVGYAIGHALLFAGLASMFLIGVFFVPLLIRCDIERWRLWEERMANDCGAQTQPTPHT